MTTIIGPSLIIRSIFSLASVATSLSISTRIISPLDNISLNHLISAANFVYAFTAMAIWIGMTISNYALAAHKYEHDYPDFEPPADNPSSVLGVCVTTISPDGEVRRYDVAKQEGRV
jgi:hypothetical protein